MEVLAQRALIKRPGVRVRGANHNIRDRDACPLARSCARVGRDVQGDAYEVASDERKLLRALLEDESFRVERIVDTGREALAKVPGQAVADGRSDVNFSRADAERWGRHGLPGSVLAAEEQAHAEEEHEDQARRNGFHALKR